MDATMLATQTQAALSALKEKRDATTIPWLRVFLTQRIDEAERMLNGTFEPRPPARRAFSRREF